MNSRPPLCLLALLLALGPGCGGAEQSRPPARPAPAPGVRALDKILDRMEKNKREAAAGETVAACVARVRSELGGECPVPAASARTYKLRVALDPKYQHTWPEWEERFMGVLGCVNQIYAPTNTGFELESVVEWKPGAQRNDLRRLLDRLRREVPADSDVLRLGVVVWSQRRAMFSVGGEIGLSRAEACVVPSWPRVENDCLITAHELGHLVGARHVPGKNWIMAWRGHTYRLPVNDPVARVVKNHRFHPRNLEGIRAHHLARGTTNGLEPTHGCARYLDAMDRCWALTGLR